MLMGITGCSVFGGTAAEEPAHTVTLSDGDFEIRDYAPYAVAQTTVSAAFDDAVSDGFGRLFGYISGANKPSAKIEMTAPVMSEPSREKIAMTAPVLAAPGGDATDAGQADLVSETSGGWTISFVLPSGYSAATAPQPANADVALRDVPSRQVAVVRFSGRFSNEVAEQNRQRLANWLRSRGRQHRGDWQFAGYNPPWTIPALRRNEVMVTLR